MEPATRSEMEEITRRWIEAGWRHGDTGIVDELHEPNFVGHDPGGRPPDNGGFKLGVERLYLAFPDLTAELLDLLVDTETGAVAVRWSAVGTREASSREAEPTSRRIGLKGIDILEQLGRVRL